MTLTPRPLRNGLLLFVVANLGLAACGGSAPGGGAGSGGSMASGGATSSGGSIGFPNESPGRA